MKPLYIKPRYAFIAGTALTLPAIYFIFISLMKYVFSQPYLFDASYPLLKQLGISESLGLNINLLIVFGPVLAFFLNLLPVFHFRFQVTADEVNCQFSIRKNWLNLFLILASSSCLLILSAYLALENCRCG